MIIRNISSKIVHIGSKMILPDNEISIPDEEGNIPAIAAMKRVGLIVTVETPKAVKVEKTVAATQPKKKVVVEEKNEENVEKIEKAVKRVTKKKAE